MSLSNFIKHEEYYYFNEWFVIFMNKWRSTWWFWWISIKDLRETILKFFRMLFSKWIIKHNEICLKEELNEWWCLTIEEERCIKWCLIFNKENKILFVNLINSLANNKDSLSLNLLIDLILEQFMKILYHNSCNQVNFAYLMSDK